MTLDNFKSIQEEFKKLYKNNLTGGGGFLRKQKRKQLLGLTDKEQCSRVQTTDFRYRLRKKVKTALIDLQLFIQTANYKDVDKVINLDTLTPLFRAMLFQDSKTNKTKMGTAQAKIAQLMIETGYEYLKTRTSNVITSNQKQMIQDAVALSKQLTILMIPQKERIDILKTGKTVTTTSK